MKKELPKNWANVPYKTWKYEKQTEMKHKVFGYYLPLWLSILGRYHKNLNFVDGFGGIGSYHTDEDEKNGKFLSRNFGSPIISLLEIFKLESLKKINKANILIIEKEKENVANLKTIIDFLKIKITGVIDYREGNFDSEINKFLDTIDASDSKLAPTFFLIDPFGIAEIKMATIKRIMSKKNTEILLNFMYNCLQRWVAHPDEKINKIYDEYFGSDIWRNCKGKKLYEKEAELVKIFRDNCKNFCKFVYPFRLRFPHKDQTYYYLFHLSQHYKGCSLMKDSFAKFNDGKSEYRGENYKSSLFESMEAKEKKEEFIKKICIFYSGKKIKWVDILNDFIDETDLLESEIKKLLKPLENDKRITVQSGDGRMRRGGFRESDYINFVKQS